MLHSYFMKIHFNYRYWRCRNLLLNDYYKALEPLLELSIEKAPLLALDLEMTGLDAKKDQIISIGLIPITNGEIKLNKGQHKLLKITGSVGQSATIHGVLDKDLQQALPLNEAILWLLKEAKGHILVAHHAPLDLSFIEQALMQQTTQKCRLFAIDTMRIEHKRLAHRQQIIKEGDLRLGSCRSRYNLPNYEAHNALVDALSCAELLLAQLSRMGGAGNVKVSELIC
ncbi:exonuclease domain-containing protein [Psychromonas antarctica]|uniref:exonuclease domain-containing protein n=1 Tax=Psychromonas antarctica TaxID=67573 RepID=UPI001EE8BF00|nr:exonuclease domain-containing protein [Psychromonas antarctica]MCG6201068.1 3'-5' exonuclease [Psychromonas antarctica]